MNPLTGEFIQTVLWLACATGDYKIKNTGSALVFLQEGQQYVATAKHVVEDCARGPFLGHNGKWHELDWETVAEDNEKDIIVLKTRAELTRTTPTMGMGRTYYGAVGRALGFPKVSDGVGLRTEAKIFGESGGRPLPVPAVVAARIGGEQDEWSQYVGGYINNGFSGGPILFPTLDRKGREGWTVVGIITERGAVAKQVGTNTKGESIVEIEPTGMVKFTKIEAVLDMLPKTDSK